jgi:hypothetical membrane protein
MIWSGIFFPFAWFGLAGGLVVLLALGVPMAAYIGKAGERYSPLNHFVSELGETGVSRLAVVFNLGLIAAGILFIPFVIGLGLSVENLWAKLGSAAGCFSSIACILIGFFPMNKLRPHIIAAIAFFDGSLATVILFTLSYWLQPAAAEFMPRGMAAVGLFCIALQTVFFFIGPRLPSDAGQSGFLHTDPTRERPAVWHLPIFEWLVVLSVTAWYLSTAFVLLIK